MDRMKYKRNAFKVVLFCVIACVCVASSVVRANENNDIRLTSKSAIVMDASTGEVIYEYNSHEKLQIASTTKLMTALLLAENMKEDDVLKFSDNAMKQPSTSVYKDIANSLDANDAFKASDVMDGLLLKSGNDMAIVIAENIAGDEKKFSDLMDKKARELGMNDTDFYTASGLDMDYVLDGNNHYSTAYDMALLGIAAYENEWVRESMSKNNSVFSTIDGDEFQIENSNKNLGTNGCVGGKTGYTTKAQRCLVGVYEREGRVLVGVVLGGSNPGYFEDMDKIMNFAYQSNPKIIISQNDIFYKKQLELKRYILFGKNINVELPLYIKEDLTMYDNAYNLENTEYNVEIKDMSILSISSKNPIGKLTIKESNSIKEFDLYTNVDTKNILIANFKEYIFVFMFFVILGVSFVCKINKRVR